MAEDRKHEGCITVETKHGKSIEICPVDSKNVKVNEK